MKRFLLLLLVCSGLFVQGQVYNNEWIDYNKTYYKFKIGASGLYRISQSTLSSFGLGSTPAEQFQLWRNGQEVSLFTSVQTGAMSSSDYIEFWGEMNDGKPDNVLYRSSGFQLNDKWSLLTDTAAFFLTVNPSGNNLRLVPTANNVAANILPPDSYFAHTIGKYNKERLNAGYAAVVGVYVYSSEYDQGEGWTSADIATGTKNAWSQKNLNVYNGAGAPDPTLKVNAAGNAIYERRFRININGDSIAGQQMDYFEYAKLDIPFSLSMLSNDTVMVDVTNQSPEPFDRMVVAKYEITYPRQFNFGNARNFYFELLANVNGNYLEISNFNYNGVAPVLYDLTNGKRYVTDISNPSLIKIALLPSIADRKLVLVSEDVANIHPVTSFQSRNFTNFSLATNQGDYLIITHPVLTAGNNPVNDYKNYRNSATGGGYNAKVYLIDELIDQFGLGIKKNPLAIRNFIRWARTHFGTVPIKNILLIGKGVTYAQYRVFESHPDIEKLAMIPTFGNPGSDNLLAAEPGLDVIPKVPIGRISAISPAEVAVYLEKVKQYEQAQSTPSPLINDKAWQKNVMHVVGASDENLTNVLKGHMDSYKQIITDTFYGGHVRTFSKTSSDEIERTSSAQIQALFQEGMGLITYFGHSASSSLAFDLDNPQNYNNTGKYPVMVALGCLAGNFFNFNLARFQTQETLSEKFVLADQKGTIAFIASSHYGIVQYLDKINTQFYNAASKTHYGQTLGQLLIESATQVYNGTTQNDFYARLHCEEVNLHGDPALKMINFPKPDYVVEDPLVRISPSFISIAETQFRVDVKVMNIGKVVNKDIVIEVKRTYPNQTGGEIIKRDTIPYLKFSDSLSFYIPILATRDQGLNKITITVDANNDVDELYETNNSVTKDVFIFKDEARPVYPNNYAIVNRQNIKLLASTADPFPGTKQYQMELDTSTLFNSSLKVTRTITSPGGLLEFDPGVTFINNTVYYWRVAPVPASGSPIWNSVSFIYLAGSDYGFNQSHFYQHTKSSTERIFLDSTSRTWKFKPVINNIFIRSGIYPTASTQTADFTISVDGDPYIGPGCGTNEIFINIFDAITFKPWLNKVEGSGGLYGSAYPLCGPRSEYNFRYSLADTLWRRRAQNFLDSVVPDGAYVVIRSNTNSAMAGNTFVPVWKSDTTFFGSGNSLYHSMLNQGFSNLDLYDTTRCFVFVYKKNRQSNFTPKSIFSDNIYDRLLLSIDCPTQDTLGYIKSPLFGPAKEWKQLTWRGATSDITVGDMPKIDVIGVNSGGVESTLLSDLSLSQQDIDISSINASSYPYITLRMRNVDSINLTPYQLQYWRLTYVPIPEGALVPDFAGKDSVEVGEPLKFGVVFKNISDVPFTDSMKVKFAITDKDNVQTIVPIARKKIMQPGDTVRLEVPINTDPGHFAGDNIVFFSFNPDNDQPEQQFFNNFGFKSLYVRPDNTNPLMDVTFNGIHILNRDIVSSKPDIVVKLKDEAKWLILDDTSLLTLKIKFPNGTTRRYFFNNDTLKFLAAGQAPNPNNTATVQFKPYFTMDGEYQLTITGKDKSNNKAGNLDYHISFQVINKPMISNMLNYPNPFTTSTAFVFTITGSEVPQNVKIEIMTITGKIVREITKDELGRLQIGRNITEFKWDGTDQFGQKLANGIYLYRVVTNLNGKMLDKYKADEDETEKYFNKGYGKMYLMR